MLESSLDEFITQKNLEIEKRTKKTENVIKNIERSFENIEIIDTNTYNWYFDNVSLSLHNATQNIKKYKTNEYIEKTRDHIAHIILQNELIEQIAVETLVKLNQKKMSNMTLGKTTAKTLKLLGVEKNDLPSHVKDVYERHLSST